MKKVYTLDEIKGFKRISSIAAIYKGRNKVGVSPQYIKELIDDGKIEVINIDGFSFIDPAGLPDEIKMNLKK
jgi:hypothetical protein